MDLIVAIRFVLDIPNSPLCFDSFVLALRLIRLYLTRIDNADNAQSCVCLFSLQPPQGNLVLILLEQTDQRPIHTALCLTPYISFQVMSYRELHCYSSRACRIAWTSCNLPSIKERCYFVLCCLSDCSSCITHQKQCRHDQCLLFLQGLLPH
jgi:hypothetical protein